VRFPTCFEISGGFHETFRVEGDFAHHPERVEVRRVEPERDLGPRFGAVVVLQSIAAERGHFTGELGAGRLALGLLDLLLEELCRGVDVTARHVGRAQDQRRRAISRIGLDCELVTLDCSVVVAPRFQNLRGTNEMLRAFGCVVGLVGELFDGAHRAPRFAGVHPQLGQRLERLRIVRVERQSSFVGADRTLRNSEAVSQDAPESERLLDLPRAVAAQEIEMPLEDDHHVVEALERAIVPR